MDYNFKVESGIPIAKRTSMISKRLVLEDMYPVRTMQIGDSFFVPHTVIRQATVQVGFSRINQRGIAPGKFRVARVSENDVVGSRVWRIA